VRGETSRWVAKPKRKESPDLVNWTGVTNPAALNLTHLQNQVGRRQRLETAFTVSCIEP
jgi:hypothetical protein